MDTRRGARAAQVLVGQVEDLLVVRVGVDRRHLALHDPEGVVQHLGHRGEAVRRAGGVRDDVVLLGVVLVVVDADDDREVLALGGGGDDDLLGAGRDVGLGLVGVGEEAGGLEHVLDAEVLPGELRRVLDGEDLDLAARPRGSSSPSAFTSSGRLPRIESYFRRWASVGASVMSFTATNSSSLSWRAVRRMLRPMRPKPLMPTRIAMACESPSESDPRVYASGRERVKKRAPLRPLRRARL